MRAFLRSAFNRGANSVEVVVIAADCESDIFSLALWLSMHKRRAYCRSAFNRGTNSVAGLVDVIVVAGLVGAIVVAGVVGAFVVAAVIGVIVASSRRWNM